MIASIRSKIEFTNLKVKNDKIVLAPENRNRIAETLLEKYHRTTRKIKPISLKSRLR